MTTRALIADDEPHLARALQAELAALWPELQVVAVARNGVEAAERIAALQPDLAFLDIQMPGLTGLEVAQGIEGTTRVVFVTAYDEYAVQAFEAEAVDYVLKPVSRERLQRTVERLRRALARAGGRARRRRRDAIAGGAAAAAARGHGGRRGRPRTPALGARQRRRHHAPDRRGRGAVLPRRRQVHLRADGAGRVPDPHPDRRTGGARSTRPVFVQVHRSTIVNLQHLAGTRRDEASRLFLRIKGHAHELPVSRAYVPLFKAM